MKKQTKSSPHRSNRRPSSDGDSIVTVGLTQMACTPDFRANLKNQIRLVEQAARGGARIICTQELFGSQYFCQVEDHRFFKLAETIPGPSTDAFSKIAKKHKVVIIASLFERRTQGLYHNTAVVIDADGSIAGIYRKMHIPDDPLYYEKFYFTPGDAAGEQAGFRTWNTKYAKIGVLICWDQWFPEGARLTAIQGAQILFYPTAIGWHPSEKAEYGEAQHDSWELMQRSHAVANGCYVCAPNRIGVEHILDATGKPVSEEGIQFWGQVLRRRAEWASSETRIGRQGGDPDRPVRPGKGRVQPHSLAVPPRQAHRRVREPHQTFCGCRLTPWPR
jgi:N-carbamoylputrescine amidase